MPLYYYRGRDKYGAQRAGERSALSTDALGNDLLKEGITPVEIRLSTSKQVFGDKILSLFQNKAAQLEDLSIFARQMALLHHAGVPIVTSIRQISTFTRMQRLSNALEGCVDYIEKGEKLSSAMQHFPNVFPKLIVNIIQIGESTGKLTEAFNHLHEYLEFEAKNIKQIKSAFRYPMFVSIAILIAIIILNIFVIPTFGRFYSNMEVTLPWQTRLLIGSSNLMVHYGLYILIVLIIGSIVFIRSIQTNEGAFRWGRFLIRLPLIGKLIKRLILIRISQSMAIILNAGLGVTQSLSLVRDLIGNAYIKAEIDQSQEQINRGTMFTQAIKKIELFTPLELQIISVGEKNGELGNAMSYIGHFHANEVEFDLKRMSDWLGPILIAAISIMILIVALGIYLPIWNMINLSHT